jgi:hypothetical protein
MNGKRVFLVLTIAMAILSACKKYDDGPLMSLYSKGGRVAGTWYFQSVLYNNIDSTKAYNYQRLVFFYDKDIDGGGFTWNKNFFAINDENNPMLVGVWNFISDRDSLQMVVFENFHRDSIVYKWKINRLAYTEFWMETDYRDTVKLHWDLVKYAY